MNRIFLHFLDREACYLSGSMSRKARDFLEIFKVCAIGSYEPMILSAGHLFEHQGAHLIYKNFVDLFHSGQVSAIGDGINLEEFSDGKLTQYSHTSKSSHRDYSIYNKGNWEAIFHQPIILQSPKLSTTIALAGRVASDLGSISENPKRLIEIIQNRGKRAITIELFTGRDLGEANDILHKIQASISANYQAIYREEYGKLIFVGTGLISPFIEAGCSHGISFELAKYFYQNCNFGRIFDSRSFQLSQLRGTIDHSNFVELTRSLFFEPIVAGQSHQIGYVLERILPRCHIGREVKSDIDSQLISINRALRQFGPINFYSLHKEIAIEFWSMPKQFCSSTVDALKQEIGDDEVRHSKTNESRNSSVFFVVAARKELEYIRSYLKSLEIVIESDVSSAGNRYTDSFEVNRIIDGKALAQTINLVRANGKGKGEMRSLLESIVRNHQPRIVIMIGMMAGISGKSNLFDVIAPRHIFDTTNVGTKSNSAIVEPIPSDMDLTLHNWISNFDWSDSDVSDIKTVTDKATVTVPGTIDDITHEIAQRALAVDPENVVGIEMEGSALSEMQRDQTQVGDQVKYLMIKGVADFAGSKLSSVDIERLSLIPSMSALFADGTPKEVDPRSSNEIKGMFQKEATIRSTRVAIKLIQKFRF